MFNTYVGRYFALEVVASENGIFVQKSFAMTVLGNIQCFEGKGRFIAMHVL
jgi:hypothetical protein